MKKINFSDRDEVILNMLQMKLEWLRSENNNSDYNDFSILNWYEECINDLGSILWLELISID